MSKRFIEVKEVRGKASTLELICDEESYNIFLRKGIIDSIPKKYKNKVVVLAPEDIDYSNFKQVEISDELCEYYINLAINNILKDYLKESKNECKSKSRKGK